MELFASGNVTYQRRHQEDEAGNVRSLGSGLREQGMGGSGDHVASQLQQRICHGFAVSCS